MNSGAEVYRTARFEHAPPLKLVQMMYEGALRFLVQAEEALGRSESGRFQERCLRAHAVVGELRLALDATQAPELAAQLESLYLFAEAEIRAAVAAEDGTRLAPVREVLTTLLEGWNQLELAR
jgi:flagellar protein FliS